MSQQLSLTTRPKSLDSLVGQERIVSAIRGHMASGRVVNAWMFTGPRGSGKTSISRILALSYQCSHQEKFGKPCKACYASKAQFPIYEIPCADFTGIDKLRNSLNGADYGVMGDAQFRVYVLDEVHASSDSSQKLLLKYVEDAPATTVYILCSTAPWQILEALRSRCVIYELRELDTAGIEKLVARTLKFAHSDLPADRLVESLTEKGVRSPRLIVQAVEKYVAGLGPDDSADVEGVTLIDVRSMTKAVTRGDWESVRRLLLANKEPDVRGIRLSLLAYLRVVLLESAEFDERGKTLARAITMLCSLQNAENSVIYSGLISILYTLTELFSRYKL